MEKYREIVLPNSGVKNWGEGAYTIAFVFSKTEGNYVLKGYYREVNKYLENKTHWFAKLTLWHQGNFRTIHKFWKNEIIITEPNRKKSKYIESQYKWRIKLHYIYLNNNKELTFRRLPKRWVTEMEIF